LNFLLAIRDVLLDESWNSYELLNLMVNAMYGKFDKYWSELNLVLFIATVLDPSMKMAFIRFYFRTISANVEGKIRDLRTSLMRIYEDYEKVVKR
jgi:hypothetical protein